MGKQRCEDCGSRVRIAGGIGDMWSCGGPSGGMTLAFEDGTERFLCFDCIAALDDDWADDPDCDDGPDRDGGRE